MIQVRGVYYLCSYLCSTDNNTNALTFYVLSPPKPDKPQYSPPKRDLTSDERRQRHLSLQSTVDFDVSVQEVDPITSSSSSWTYPPLTLYVADVWDL